jgi:adenylate cyclase
MQDVPQERSDADAEPSGKVKSKVRFAGLIFDLDACALARESGEAIALTRGEFRLLRLFISRPGRVLSRDAILVAANRRFEPFDRSVDALVGRLRRKIEPDPKAPRLIVTVPGEGYRFDGLAPALRGAPADGAAESDPRVPAEPPGADRAPEAARAAEPAQLDTAPPPPSAASAAMRSWRWPAIAAALVLALFAGAYGWRSGLAPRFMGTATQDRLATAPRLSIVVLPFENMSGDKEQDYFADGITDALTTDLSHLHDSFVIARGTAFTYKGKPIDAKQIGKDLGVRYVLEGSVRRAGEKVEINAQLISTETGAHVWADRFDGERSKLGELQVEVVARLARSLGVELVKAEALRAARERPSNPDAVDLAMQAQVKYYPPERKANINEAVTLSERALALDPQNVRALTFLTNALLERVTDHWSDDPAGDIARAERASDTAMALESGSSSVHHAKAFLYDAKQE